MELLELTETIRSLEALLSSHYMDKELSERLIKKNLLVFGKNDPDTRIKMIGGEYSNETYAGIMLTANGLFIVPYTAVHKTKLKSGKKVLDNDGDKIEENCGFCVNWGGEIYDVEENFYFSVESNNISVLKANTGGAPIPLKIRFGDVDLKKKLDFLPPLNGFKDEVSLRLTSTITLGDVEFKSPLVYDGHVYGKENCGGAIVHDGKLAGLLGPSTVLSYDNAHFQSQYGTTAPEIVRSLYNVLRALRGG